MTEQGDIGGESMFTPGRQEQPTSQEGVYEVSPKDAGDDIIINLSESAAIVPKDHDRTASVKLEQGDRLRTKKYGAQFVGLVTGLSLLKSIPVKLADELEHKRKVRVGLEPDEYQKEAHAMKGKEPVANALSTGNALQDAIRDSSKR